MNHPFGLVTGRSFSRYPAMRSAAIVADPIHVGLPSIWALHYASNARACIAAWAYTTARCVP